MKKTYPQRPLMPHEANFLQVMEQHYADRKKEVKGFTGKNLIMNRYRQIKHSLTNNTISTI
jgi:hypothetical protein